MSTARAGMTALATKRAHIEYCMLRCQTATGLFQQSSRIGSECEVQTADRIQPRVRDVLAGVVQDEGFDVSAVDTGGQTSKSQGKPSEAEIRKRQARGRQ